MRELAEIDPVDLGLDFRVPIPSHQVRCLRLQELMRRIPTLIALLIAAALALGGCGEDGETTTATTPDSGSQRSATATQGKKAEQGGGTADGRRRSSAGKTTQEEGTPSASRPEPEEGAKAAAPGVPTSKGGDNSVQTYGLEAGSEERAEATAAVQAFLDARVSANWARACSLLAAEQRRMFEQLAKRTKEGGSGTCAEIMAAFASGVPASAFAEEANIVDVLSLRVGEEHAFLIYTRPDGNVYATAITREGGGWKIISVGPTQLG